MSVNRNRLDNWFWCARFVKSKTLAGKLCRSGTVRVNGNLTKKAHFNIKVGDVVTFPLGIQPIRGSRRPTKYKRRQFERFKAKM